MAAKMAALSFGLLSATGCGFEPLHAQHDGAPGPDELAQVKIELIEDRRGQELRNELLDRFNAGGRPGEPRYRLQVHLRETETPVAIENDGTAARSNLSISAAFALTSVPEGKIVMQGVTTGLIGYGIITNSYATLVGKQDAERRAVRQLADDITTRVSLYLQRQSAAESGVPQ